MIATTETIPEMRATFVGTTPALNYALAIVTQFKGGAPDVERARGAAEDVAEPVRREFVEGCPMECVTFGTEQVTNGQGRDRTVSAIEIHLGKQA